MFGVLPGGAVRDPVAPRFVLVRKARAFPDGRLLVIFSASSTTPCGYGIAMLDRESCVLWKDFRHIHHSFDVAAGNVDLLHANDVEILPAAFAGQFPFAEAGQLLVSLREIDAIVIVDHETERVVWLARGGWHRQHDADFRGRADRAHGLGILRTDQARPRRTVRAGSFLGRALCTRHAGFHSAERALSVAARALEPAAAWISSSASRAAIPGQPVPTRTTRRLQERARR